MQRFLLAVALIAFARQPAPGAEFPSATLPQSPLKLILSAPPVAPGAVAQLRLAPASPIAISSGAIEMEIDPAVFGPPRSVEVFSAAGDQMGSATFSSNKLKVSFWSRSGGIGRIPGLPILVVTIPVLAPTGRTSDLRLLPTDTLWRDAQGNRYATSAEPARFRVGGNLSIDAVTPGGGLLPEGATVRIEGRGFSPATTVRINGVPLASTNFVSPNAIVIRIAAPVDLTGRQVVVRNSTGESTDFYPALKSEMVPFPNGEIVQYVFPQQLFVEHMQPSFALQNPYPEPVTVTLRHPPLRSTSPPLLLRLTLSPGQVFYSLISGLFPPVGFTSSVPVRLASARQFSASGPTRSGVYWKALPPRCYPQGTQTDETCWLVLAGSGPASAALVLPSPGAYAAVAQTDRGDWLKISPETGTGGEIAVTVDPSLLAPGDYKATITVRFADPTYAPATIPFILRAADSVVDFRNAPPYFYFMGRSTDPPPPPIQVDVTATKDGTPFRVDFESSAGTDWLLINPREGVTPATLDITFDPRVLGREIRRTAIIVLRGPASSVAKPSAVEITDPRISIDSSRKVFWWKPGDAPPAPTTIPFQYYAAGSEACFAAALISASTQSGGSWLTAARAGNSGTVEISVDPARVTTGTYEGAVAIATPANPECINATVPVSLIVTKDDPPIAVDPPTIELSAPSGTDTYPTAEEGFVSRAQVRVRLAESGYAVDFSAAASTEDNIDWLIVTREYPTGTMTVRGNPVDLPPGTYRGAVRVNAPPGSNRVVTVPVTFNVGPALPLLPLRGPPLAVSVANAASQVVGAVAPGELVTIHGVNLTSPFGPPTRVLFDDIGAPVLYASPTQLNLAVPVEISGRTSVQISIESGGWRSTVGTAVAESAPALFTSAGSGLGQARALNLPEGESNSTLRPAARGAAVRLFATGVGRIPAFSVKVANVNANVTRIALSSDSSGGVFEIDAIVPSNIAPGPAVPVVIESGSVSSPEGVTIAVK